MSTKVSVKWNKQVLKDLEVDTTEPVELFKTQLWTLTGVPPDRQTLMVKGMKLKDDAHWDSIPMKKNTTIMMMGTVGEIDDRPKETIVFAEDLEEMNPDAGAGYDVVKRGFVNPSNMCYVNSTVQVDELKPILKDLEDADTQINPSIELGKSLNSLLKKLDPAVPSPASIDPMPFFNVLKTINPEFGQTNEVGMYKQQDAEECWSLCLQQLSMALPTPADGMNPIDQLFGVTMEEVCTNAEESGEVIKTTRTDRILRCHIGNKTSHLFEGIQEALEEEVERNSTALGRDAKWNQVSRIGRLPPYLAIHFVRFRWKASERVKAKILRSVSFPFTLDVFDFCTDELKSRLKGRREEAVRRHEDAMHVDSTDKGAEASSSAAASSTAASSKDDQKGAGAPVASSTASTTTAETNGTSTGAANANGEPDVAMSKDDAADAAEGAPMLVESPLGVYELVAVMTHQGRIAESGHYVSWCKDSSGTWFRFDDDKVYEQTEEDIRKLTGGGDWHIAYMLLYKAKRNF